MKKKPSNINIWTVTGRIVFELFIKFKKTDWIGWVSGGIRRNGGENDRWNSICPIFLH